MQVCLTRLQYVVGFRLRAQGLKSFQDAVGLARDFRDVASADVL